MPEQGALGYDAEDMFGVRRALEILPVSSWDQFLFEWRSLTEVADFDVYALDAVIRRQARRRSHYEGTNDPVAAAWTIVTDATARYVAWHETHATASGVGDPPPMSRAS
ncbi:MAG TPA: hypothetical protein VLV81_09745 [Acidimicrobiia bacterium]|nr:hypothetical protein [Acidimicrobiia bacterium]